MPYQQTAGNAYSIPQGMMLVPIPRQASSPLVIEHSQYKPPTIVYNNSFKNNKVAPPPSIYNTQTGNPIVPTNSFQSPSSMISTNPLIQPSYVPQKQQQQQVLKHIDQSKIHKKKPKKQSTAKPSYTNNSNRAFTLYNQNNGRTEGAAKNRHNVVNDDTDESKIIDEEPESKGKWTEWLSQPLCFGLTRLSGIVLFGSMILLSCASIAGLIASIALYSQDSVTDAQWKILGMVVCAIMLITIIITLLIFICCYKHGYMFNKDDDVDPNDPSANQDVEGNRRQTSGLRNMYKFNRPNDRTSITSERLQDVSSSASTSPAPAPIRVSDKQTNTETTIAPLRPKDIDRGVWPSTNAFGGIKYRPSVLPKMVSHYIQVLPHDIDETYQVPQVVYQVAAPAAVIPPSRIIQIPAHQAPVVEVLETPRKQAQTTTIRQPQTQQIVMQPAHRIEYVDEDDDVEEKRTTRRIVQQPQYEIVEEITGRRTSSSSMEEVVEIVDVPKQVRHHRRKKGKKQNVGRVSVKHVKSNGE